MALKGLEWYDSWYELYIVHCYFLNRTRVHICICLWHYVYVIFESLKIEILMLLHEEWKYYI